MDRRTESGAYAKARCTRSTRRAVKLTMTEWFSWDSTIRTPLRPRVFNLCTKRSSLNSSCCDWCNTHTSSTGEYGHVGTLERPDLRRPSV